MCQNIWQLPVSFLAKGNFFSRYDKCEYLPVLFTKVRLEASEATHEKENRQLCTYFLSTMPVT